MNDPFAPLDYVLRQLLLELKHGLPPISPDNVHWRYLPKDAKVYDRGSFYTTDTGAVIYWEGNEVESAQRYLNSKVKETREATDKQLQLQGAK